MITSSFEIITPEKAAEYLKMNTNNYRRLNKNKVATYAEDIRNGNWKTNGESISFDQDGILKNGQHRLAAIVEANKPIMTLVVRGVENDVGIYDSGMTRTVSQIARAEGIIVSSNIIAAANILFGGFHKSGGKATVKQYVYDHLDELRKANNIAQFGCNHALGRKASICLSVYCIRRFEMINDEILYDFFWVFNNQNIKPDQKRNPSPALVAARAFLQMTCGASGDAKKKQMSIILQALSDYKKNANRIKAYSTEKDETPIILLNKIRKMDGISK